MKNLIVGLATVSVLMFAVPAAFAGDGEYTKCKMDFQLKSWSIIFKKADGEGVIKCSNGQTAKVKLRLRGGGLTAGKGEIREGHGVFSEVRDIDELFGSYVAAEAHAGAVKSADAQAMTKGEVSLALSGKGAGVDLGIAVGKFTIKRK